MNVDLKDLKAKAEEMVNYDGLPYGKEWFAKLKIFNVAANPQVVLALIDRIEKAEGELQKKEARLLKADGALRLLGLRRGLIIFAEDETHVNHFMKPVDEYFAELSAEGK